MIMPFMQGFGTGGGLIVAIGAQNAFVLSEGVRGNYHIIIALICILCDAVFITLGIAGFGASVAAHPSLSQWVTWGDRCCTCVGSTCFEGLVGPMRYDLLVSQWNLT